MQVRAIMSNPVTAVEPQTPLKDVARLLLDRGFAGVPVVEDGHLVGFVSESDVLAAEQAPDVIDDGGRLAHLLHRPPREHARAPLETVRDAMSSPPVVVEPWESVWAAASTMCEQHVHQLPVVSKGRLIGLVSRSDLVRAYSRPDDEIADEIRDEVLPELGLNPTLVHVSVDGGHVTLTGGAERASDAACLPRAVRRVPGVVSVETRVEAAR